MDNIFISLQAECKKAGTNLTRICHKAGVSRSTVARWGNKEPNTIRIYRKLMAMIEAEAAERQRIKNRQDVEA